MHPILKSCQVNLHSYLPDNNKAVKYSDQSENSSWHVLDFDTYRFNRPIADCSVEDINPDMTPYAIVDFSVSPEIKKKKSIKKI